MTRKGYVLRLAGDGELTAAIADGMIRGTEAAVTRREAMPAAGDDALRQRTDAALLRIAVNRCKGPDEYALDIAAARYKYGSPRRVRVSPLVMLLVMLLEFHNYVERAGRCG